MNSEIRTKSINLLKNDHFSNQVTDLLAQWNAFLHNGLLDIYFEIAGVDQTPFSSVINDEKLCGLIAKTEKRLAHAFKNQNVYISPSIKDNLITVLWIPPYPIKLNQLTSGDKDKLKKAVDYLLQDMSLLVHSISFIESTDGIGDEELFYDRYFVPKQFNEMLGLQQQVIFKEEEPAELVAEDATISDFLQANSFEDLENTIQSKLQQPYGFEISNSCKNIMASARILTYFMPHFKAYLELDESNTLQKITELVASKLTVVETSEVNGKACIECLAHEGPFAETIGLIIENIHVTLGPYLLKTFEKIGFEKVQLQFLLHVWY